MNGELAALIALTLHGNAWLRSPDGRPPSLESDNSAYKFVNRLSFVQPSGRWRKRTTAETGTERWLSQLPDAGITGLLLQPALSTGDSRLSPAIASSFANGMPRGVVTIGQSSHLWLSSWEVTERDRPDSRIWSVTMSRADAVSPEALSAASKPVESAARHLAAALIQIERFAAGNNLDYWADWFRKATYQLHADSPEVPYNPDLAPTGELSLQRHRLLAGAFQAWVFGGMGSWNDLWLEDETQSDELRRVTDQLYEAVIDAVTAAANAP